MVFNRCNYKPNFCYNLISESHKLLINQLFGLMIRTQMVYSHPITLDLRNLVMSQSDKKPIIVVDDSNMDIDLIQIGLKANGINNGIKSFFTGEDFLAYMTQVAHNPQIGVPELVLLDVNLPKLSGHETIKKLRAIPKFEKNPIITMLSHSVEKKDEEMAIKNGANSYMVKPAGLNEWISFSQYIKKHVT